MPTFENVEVIGPKARRAHDQVVPEPETADVPPPIEDGNGPPAQPDWLKTNRRLAIFGAFAVGVFLGSLARS